MNGRGVHEASLWSAAQRRALLLILTAFLIIASYRLLRDRRSIGNPRIDPPPRAGELADRMDPNTADWQDLAAVSGLGEKKAHAIVAFREQWIVAHPNTPAFAAAKDLQHIKGIGPATVANLEPYLIFPTTDGKSPRDKNVEHQNSN